MPHRQCQDTHMKAMTLFFRQISTSSNRKRSLRLRSASSTVLYCVLQAVKQHSTTQHRHAHPYTMGQQLCCLRHTVKLIGCHIKFRQWLSAPNRFSCLPAHGQHCHGDAVKLIKASPSTRLGQALVNLAHGLVVHLVAAVEHIALAPYCTRQILHGLSLAGSCSASVP